MSGNGRVAAVELRSHFGLAVLLSESHCSPSHGGCVWELFGAQQWGIGARQSHLHSVGK